MLPFSGSIVASKGGWDHLWGSTGTTSVWELRRMEGRSGFLPGHFRRIKGLFLTNSMVRDSRERDLAWERMKSAA